MPLGVLLAFQLFDPFVQRVLDPLHVVDDFVHFLFAGHDYNFNMRSVAHHQRPVCERVRRNWRDHEALDVRHENGAAGGERIRSRTGCRRNN